MKLPCLQNCLLFKDFTDFVKTIHCLHRPIVLHKVGFNLVFNHDSRIFILIELEAIKFLKYGHKIIYIGREYWMSDCPNNVNVSPPTYEFCNISFCLKTSKTIGLVFLATRWADCCDKVFGDV